MRQLRSLAHLLLLVIVMTFGIQSSTVFAEGVDASPVQQLEERIDQLEQRLQDEINIALKRQHGESLHLAESVGETSAAMDAQDQRIADLEHQLENSKKLILALLALVAIGTGIALYLCLTLQREIRKNSPGRRNLH